jgi:hypothetical protein
MERHVPNRQAAIIESRKLADYLLSPEHPVGQNKARVFARCGYDQHNVDDLITELKRIITEGQLVGVVESLHGSKYTLDNMVHELDTVVITRDVPERGIVAGDIGVVAHLYTDSHIAEVEFVSGEGTTLAVETLPITDIRPVGAREILHARPGRKLRFLLG